jgi:hypothetical protein
VSLAERVSLRIDGLQVRRADAVAMTEKGAARAVGARALERTWRKRRAGGAGAGGAARSVAFHLSWAVVAVCRRYRRRAAAGVKLDTEGPVTRRSAADAKVNEVRVVRHRRFVRPHGGGGGLLLLLQRAVPMPLALVVMSERHVDRPSGRGGIEALLQHPHGGQKEQ